MAFLRNRWNNRNFYILLGFDIIAVYLSIFISIILRYEFTFPQEFISLIKPGPIITFLVIKIASFSYFGLYRGMWRYTGLWDVINVLKGNFFASVTLFLLFFYLLSVQNISKSVFESAKESIDSQSSSNSKNFIKIKRYRHFHRV